MTLILMWKIPRILFFALMERVLSYPGMRWEEHMHVESGVKETSSGQELPPVTVVKR